MDKKKIPPSRVMMLESELQKGNASLTIRNVTNEDNGHYECEVYEDKLRDKDIVQLNVIATPKVFLNTLLVLMNQLNVLSCRVVGFYPNDISVEWRKNLTSLPSQEPLQLHSNQDGTFNALSHYNYTPTSEDAGTEIYCLVKHRSLEKGQKEARLHICEPSLKVLPESKEQKVLCKLNGCFFQKAYVRINKNGECVNKSVCEKKNECLSEATMMATSGEEMKITCEAEVMGLDKPPIENCTLPAEDRSRIRIAAAAGLFSIPVIALLVAYIRQKRS
ncbi:tapasin-related protein-like [Erpetoichthys calabaricus]|uniref:tapasin-related protein-like n=1 Tax=Erpetoichthys calabaricus TaxID=27687 RepID=UPI002233FC8B|nr:tapasin-related protein-like [Erpetoichthys calabaricus]